MTDKNIKFTVNQLIKLMDMTHKELAIVMGLSESAIFKKVNKKSSWRALEVGFILNLVNEKLGYNLKLEDLEI